MAKKLEWNQMELRQVNFGMKCNGGRERVVTEFEENTIKINKYNLIIIY